MSARQELRIKRSGTYKSPVIKMTHTAIFFRKASCSFQTTGIGSSRMKKSLTILNIPWTYVMIIALWQREERSAVNHISPCLGTHRTVMAIAVAM